MPTKIFAYRIGAIRFFFLLRPWRSTPSESARLAPQGAQSVRFWRRGASFCYPAPHQRCRHRGHRKQFHPIVTVVAVIPCTGTRQSCNERHAFDFSATITPDETVFHPRAGSWRCSTAISSAGVPTARRSFCPSPIWVLFQDIIQSTTPGGRLYLHGRSVKFFALRG